MRERTLHHGRLIASSCHSSWSRIECGSANVVAIIHTAVAAVYIAYANYDAVTATAFWDWIGDTDTAIALRFGCGGASVVAIVHAAVAHVYIANANADAVTATAFWDWIGDSDIAIATNSNERCEYDPAAGATAPDGSS